MKESKTLENCLCPKSRVLDRPLFHLMRCPEGTHCKEHDSLPWYKKLLKTNPRLYDYM